jgi:branched-chain amino acid transport system substrate-binding protein
MRLLASGFAALAVLLAVTAAAGRSESTPEIRVGLLTDCGGDFGGFNDIALAGAELALLERGARLAGAKQTDGVRGATVDGHSIRLFFGCGDGTTKSALMEARRLVETAGVQILIGPFAGDEELALQEYARLRPLTTFVNGSGSAQLLDPAPNFFTFNTNGAQWMAGLGSYAYHQLGWRRAVAITETTNIFAWAQAAGFIAEFCSLGGKIAGRISVPTGTSDFSGVYARVPRRGVDGFVVAGSTDAVLALAKVVPRVGRDAGRHLVLGSAILDNRITRLGAGAAGLATAGPFYGSFPKYIASYRKAFPRIPGGVVGGPFDLFYYGAMAATLRGLLAVRSDVSGGGSRFRAALGRVVLDLPNGHFELDRLHQAKGGNFLFALQVPKFTLKVLRTLRNVDSTFGGYFSPATPPPSATSPPCVKRAPPPWAR